MHSIQKRLLELSRHHDLSTLGLRQIGRMIGENHPQKVKHHLKQIIAAASSNGVLSNKMPGSLISIPVIGQANCGNATIMAQERLNKYISVSKRLVGRDSADNLFAVEAVGDSMNRANINGFGIDSGDYVVIDNGAKNFRTGDYVLSTINNLANIKRLLKDDEHKQIVLVSESSEEYSPIFIHEQDFESYLAHGKVIAVLKQPKQVVAASEE